MHKAIWQGNLTTGSSGFAGQASKPLNQMLDARLRRPEKERRKMMNTGVIIKTSEFWF